ncbi:MAG: integrase domain-containing protein [Shewanella sp.]
MKRNINARNFGLRTSNVERALVTAYRLKANGDNSKNNCSSALRDFASHLKENGVNDLKKVTKSHVMDYAVTLKERCSSGQFSASTAQNYLSKVNVAMENARLDRSCRVDGVREAGLPTRSGIANHFKGVAKSEHNQAANAFDRRLEVQIELQRQLGLRFKESALIDARRTLEQAEHDGVIRIENGTKGGRVREFEVSSFLQIEALRHAAAIQGNDRSLVPATQSWRQYQAQCYRAAQAARFNFHAERHHYANVRYESLSGVPSPVMSGMKHGIEHHRFIAERLNVSLTEAKEIDKSSRLKLSYELGHRRISITNAYLG